MFLLSEQQISMGCGALSHGVEQKEKVSHSIKLDRNIENPKFKSQIVVNNAGKIALPQIQVKLEKQKQPNTVNPESIALRVPNQTENSKKQRKDQVHYKIDCQSEQPTKQNIENKLTKLDESKINIIIEDTIRPSRPSACKGGERLAKLKKTKSIIRDGEGEVVDSFIKIQSKDNPFQHLGKLY